MLMLSAWQALPLLKGTATEYSVYQQLTIKEREFYKAQHKKKKLTLPSASL
jgi:hypothetical protein